MPAWSREEVEATVADYFAMLDKELRGADYNKTTHRRALSQLLQGRSDGAIERKHQNISAILLELGFTYIPGYKPLSNYQQLLFDVVSDRLSASPTLIEAVQRQVTEPVQVPTVDDILAAWTEPPTPDRSAGQYACRAPQPRRGVDYIAIEAANSSLAHAGEVFALRYEVARLTHAGKDKLAARVEHVSATQGDGLGYDIRSFEETGEDRLNEVKTTKFGPATPFLVTRNELAFSQKEPDRFHLYRAFSFREAPKLFGKRGPLEQGFRLDPTEYRAHLT